MEPLFTTRGRLAEQIAARDEAYRIAARQCMEAGEAARTPAGERYNDDLFGGRTQESADSDPIFGGGRDPVFGGSPSPATDAPTTYSYSDRLREAAGAVGPSADHDDLFGGRTQEAAAPVQADPAFDDLFAAKQ